MSFGDKINANTDTVDTVLDVTSGYTDLVFYQMYAREMGEANGWRRIVTPSAKLANIVGGYGYEPVLAPIDRCVDAAVTGRLA